MSDLCAGAWLGSPVPGTAVGGSMLPALQCSRVLPGWLQLPLLVSSYQDVLHTVGNLIPLPWSPEAEQEGRQQQ